MLSEHAAASGGDPFADGDPGLDKKIIPSWLKGLSDVDYPYAQYRAEVDYLDGALDGLLNHPRILAGTVAFTADHGESFGEHGIWWDHAGLYPSTVHVPLIVAWPDAPAGTKSSAPVRQMDVSKTLLALSGLDEDDDFPGRDLRWGLEDDPVGDPRFVLASHHSTAALQAGPWLFIMDLRRHFGRALERRRITGQAELYNLADDPECRNDLLLDEFDRATRKRERRIEWLQSAEDLGLRSDQRRSAEDESMLASLGYGGGEDDAASDLWDPVRWEGEEGWLRSPWRRLFEDDSFTAADFRAALER